MTLRERLWRLLRTGWKRRVTECPDRYQAYVSFPSDDAHSRTDAVADHIAELEVVFEGSLDVYARSSGLAAVSDAVPASRFDPDDFRSVLDRIEETYAETHTLATVEKWRRLDGAVVESHVVVPVKPLFSKDRSADTRRVGAPAE